MFEPYLQNLAIKENIAIILTLKVCKSLSKKKRHTLKNLPLVKKSTIFVQSR